MFTLTNASIVSGNTQTTMTVQPPPCDRFHNNLMCMKEPILLAIKQCKKLPPSLISVDVVDNAFTWFIVPINHQELIDAFIKRTNSHWELIASSKDVSPVLTSVLGGFPELGKERVDEILRVVKDQEVDAEIQKKLLDLGKSLVRIAIRQLQVVGSTEINIQRMMTLYEMK